MLSRLGLGKPPGSENLEDFRDIADDVIESDFVPYACLADPYSIFTKNGEILQILRIPASDAADAGDLRQAIRKGLFAAIPDTSYAIWIHTIRRRTRLSLPAGFTSAWARQLEEAWNQSQQWDAGFNTALYISIVKAGQPAELTDLVALKNSFWPPRDAKQRNAYLDAALKELTATVDTLLAGLSGFGATRLGIVTREGVSHSEQLEFLESLINLESRPMPVPEQDLSHYLTSGDITFGFNAMEVRTAEGKRRFAAILTIKEYKESSLKAIDQFLELPCELIVTQSFDFVGAAEAREAYETQEHYLQLSGDQELARWAEVAQFMEHKEQPEKAYGQQQCSLFLIAPNIKTLEANIKLVRKAMSRIGIVTFREDLKFEQMYWAQLPANFPFITRNRSVHSMHLGGFANLKGGSRTTQTQSPWGPPVTLIPTRTGTPCYFHFHHKGVGHTSLIGAADAEHTLLAHFLITQAQRLNPRLWYLDTCGRAEPLITALGGAYQRPGSEALPINPLKITDSPANREFLTLWLATLLDPDGQQVSHGMMDFFDQLLAGLMPLAPERRSLTALRALLKEADPLLARQFDPWVAGGTEGGLFDGVVDRLSPGKIHGFDLSQTMQHRTMRRSLAGYLFHRLTMMLDGTPTLLVLDEGFLLLDDLLFGPRVVNWLEYLSKMNCCVVLLTGKPQMSAMLPHTPTIQTQMANRFFMPNARPETFYSTRLGLDDGLRNALAVPLGEAHLVLLQQGDHAEWLRVDLAGLAPGLRNVLAGAAAPVSTQTAAADPAGNGASARELV